LGAASKLVDGVGPADFFRDFPGHLHGQAGDLIVFLVTIRFKVIGEDYIFRGNGGICRENKEYGRKHSHHHHSIKQLLYDLSPADAFKIKAV
jgi:hypothetical protein